MESKGPSEELSRSSYFERMRRVWSGLLSTKAWARKQLIWIGDILRVECMPDQLHRLEIGLGEHISHRLLFLFSYPVLARYRAAFVDAEMKNSIREIQRYLLLPR